MTPWRPWLTSPPIRPRPPASPWMPGLYSGFDAARAGWEFPEGTCAGFLGYPSDPVSDGLESTTNTGEDANQNPCDSDQDTAVKVIKIQGLRQFYYQHSSWIQISFSAAGLGGVRTNWDAVLWQDRLYVSVTGSQLADGSKRAFVSLLEYAEEELGVSNVVACLDKWVFTKTKFIHWHYYRVRKQIRIPSDTGYSLKVYRFASAPFTRLLCRLKLTTGGPLGRHNS